MIRNKDFLNFSMVSIGARIITSLECQNNVTKCITNTKLINHATINVFWKNHYKLSTLKLSNRPSPNSSNGFLKSMHKSKKSCSFLLFLKIKNFSNYGAWNKEWKPSNKRGRSCKPLVHLDECNLHKIWENGAAPPL